MTFRKSATLTHSYIGLSLDASMHSNGGANKCISILFPTIRNASRSHNF